MSAFLLGSGETDNAFLANTTACALRWDRRCSRRPCVRGRGFDARIQEKARLSLEILLEILVIIEVILGQVGEAGDFEVNAATRSCSSAWLETSIATWVTPPLSISASLR